jgi:hypothetical protein
MQMEAGSSTLKHLYLFTNQHNVTSQIIWIVINIAARTSNLLLKLVTFIATQCTQGPENSTGDLTQINLPYLKGLLQYDCVDSGL